MKRSYLQLQQAKYRSILVTSALDESHYYARVFFHYCYKLKMSVAIKKNCGCVAYRKQG